MFCIKSVMSTKISVIRILAHICSILFNYQSVSASLKLNVLLPFQDDSTVSKLKVNHTKVIHVFFIVRYYNLDYSFCTYLSIFILKSNFRFSRFSKTILPIPIKLHIINCSKSNKTKRILRSSWS